MFLQSHTGFEVPRVADVVSKIVSMCPNMDSFILSGNAEPRVLETFGDRVKTLEL